MPTIPQLRNGELPFEKALGMKCMQKETKLIYPQRDRKKKQTSTFPDGCLTCPMLIVAEAFYWLFMGCEATDLPDKAVQSRFACRDVTERMHFIVIVALINPPLNLQYMPFTYSQCLHFNYSISNSKGIFPFPVLTTRGEIFQ